MIYTTQAQIEASLNRELTDNEGLIIDSIIELISKEISAYTTREWFSVIDEDGDGTTGETYADATARIFDGNGTPEIAIDDFVGLEQVDILDSEGNVFTSYTADTEYQTLPSNTTVKDSIRLRGGYFPDGYGNIQVTAQWGSGACPEPVMAIATSLVVKYLKKIETSQKAFKSESIEGYSYSIITNAEHDKDIKGYLMMLDTYRKLSL